MSVHLRGNSSRLALTIVDDGVGFVVEEAARQGLGLISMSERVEAMGGGFKVTSSPDRGTTLEVSLPVPMTASSGAAAG
jgi:signal transduction histidine kinase